MQGDKLTELLRADLHRLWGNRSAPGGWRLWLRIFHPRFAPVLLLRLAARCYSSRILKPLAHLFSLINAVVFGLEATPRCRIGGGLFLPHTHGTVIGAARIGLNATIFQGVTLGAKFADLEFNAAARPVVGNEVLIGAGAKVLGAISIGNRAIIAANSLVIRDVREGAYMIGVPAEDKGEVNGPSLRE